MGRICLKTRYSLILPAPWRFCRTGSWRKLELIDFANFGMMRLWAAVVVPVSFAIQYVRVESQLSGVPVLTSRSSLLQKYGIVLVQR